MFKFNNWVIAMRRGILENKCRIDSGSVSTSMVTIVA